MVESKENKNKKQRLVMIIVLVLMAGFLINWFLGRISQNTSEQADGKDPCGDYEILISERGEDGLTALRILKSGREVYSAQDYGFSSGLGGPSLCQDITGDGIPDAALVSFSGGAHCCFSTSVFSLGDEFKVVDTIATGNDSGRFEDINGDGSLEFVTSDGSFAYWNASFAGSPAPRIVLRFKDGKYALDRELMKRPLAQIESFSQDEEFRKAECESGNAWVKNGYCLTGDVWGRMLDLIYAGHERQAWEFLDTVWASDQATKESFMADFKQQLTKSTYATLMADVKGK